jgi:flagellar protein FlaG
MVGNLTTVTGAPARTPASPVAQSNVAGASSASEGAVSGKIVSAAGGELPPPEPKQADVERAVQQLNEIMRANNRTLSFRVDELSGRTVITVLDAATKEVVRQIPPPELLAVMHRLQQASGLVDSFT